MFTKWENERSGGFGARDQHTHIIIHRIDDQQEPTL